MKTPLQHSDLPDSVVVIPAYQPSGQLVQLVHTLSGSGYSVVVVDDGSGADCADVWRQLDRCLAVIHHAQNRGKGAALKTAFDYIRDAVPGAGCIVTMDADGQHLPEDMEHVALCAWTHPGALVLGSRNFEGDIPLRSKLGNKITRLVFSCVTKTRVQDTQTGLRAFDRSLLDYMLQVEGARYEYEMNVLLHCKENGIPVLEVPIQTVYLDRDNTSSHFHGVKDSLRIYRNILKFAFSSFVSFLADYLIFLLLTALLPAGGVFLLLSNVLARVGSGALNYTLNTKAVFKDCRPAAQTVPQYIGLALCVLAANSLILAILTGVLGLPPAIAKPVTEAILFLLSFTVQSCFIFKQPGKEASGRHAENQNAA